MFADALMEIATFAIVMIALPASIALAWALYSLLVGEGDEQ